MADYTYTQLEAQAKHAIGKAATADNNTLSIIVNRALDLLATMHPWTWRLRIATLTPSGGYGDLPSDFVEIVSVAAASGVTKRFAPLKPAALIRARQWSASLAAETQNPILAATVWYAVIGKAQATAADVGTMRLAVAPTTFATQLEILYLMIPASISGSNKANIPAGYFDLFLQLVRWVAMDMETPSKPETKAQRETVDTIAKALIELDQRLLGPGPLVDPIDDPVDPGQLLPAFA